MTYLIAAGVVVVGLIAGVLVWYLWTQDARDGSVG